MGIKWGLTVNIIILHVAHCKSDCDDTKLTLLLKALCVRRLEESGVEVRVLTQDASTLADATKLLKTAAQSGPVGGIFHLAVVSGLAGVP